MCGFGSRFTADDAISLLWNNAVLDPSHVQDQECWLKYCFATSQTTAARVMIKMMRLMMNDDEDGDYYFIIIIY